MLKKRAAIVFLALVVSLVPAGLMTGCDRLVKEDEPPQTEAPTETETQPPQTESETVTEPETELQTNVAYTSQDRSIRITLPDSTWTVQQDVDEMRVFSSGNAAMISIVHAANASEMKNISVAKSEDELKESQTKQYPGANAFEITEFEKYASPTLNTYEYVVKYNATSMWAYSVTYGILAADQAYVVTGTVLDDNKALLDVVQSSVKSFTVLRSSVFNVIPGKGTAASESQSQSGGDAASEMAALTDYGSSATLYASDEVRIRQQPSTEAAILGMLSRGNAVTVTGETPQWFKVSVNGNTGYVSKAFLVSNPVQTETQSDGTVSEETKVDAEMNSYTDYGTSYNYYTTTDLNVRAEPGTESAVVTSLGGGVAVTVVGETANWFKVSVNGATGYVSKSYISSTNTYTGTEQTDQTDQTGQTGSSGDGSGGGTGQENTNVGPVSGTILSAGNDTITIQGDDGNIYSINYTDASVATNNGLQDGLYISAMIDYSNTLPNGDLYATSVNGY